MSYYFIEDWFRDGTLISHFSPQQYFVIRKYAQQTWTTSRKTTPVTDKTYSTNTSLSATKVEPVILRNITINRPATLTVTACEMLIEDVLQINNGSTLEMK